MQAQHVVRVVKIRRHRHIPVLSIKMLITMTAPAPAAGSANRTALMTSDLPKSLKLLSGVKSHLDGTLFQVGMYPSGKTVEVPYIEEGAPPARMIPVSEPQPKSVPQPITTGVAERRMVRFIPKRLHVVEFRHKGQAELKKLVRPNAFFGNFKVLARGLRMHTDWHVHYHIDEEQT